MSVALKNVTVSYDRHPAIHHVNGQFADGSLTAIAGPNGGGKSTLLKAVAGLVDLEQGQVAREGLASDAIAFLPQVSEINRDFPITIESFLASACGGAAGLFRALSPPDRARIAEALAAVRLEGFGPRPLQSLSAGQFQRVLFARAMLQDAKVILLDEPFSAVDEKTQPLLLEIIKDWHAQKRTVVCVLHDVDLIARHFPDTLLIARDIIGWGPTASVLSPENIRRLQGFHEAWRDRAEVCAP